MLTQRLMVILVMVPVFVLLGAFGGWAFAVFIAAVMGVGAWEFWRMFTNGGYRPSVVLLVGGSALLVITHHALSFNGSAYMLSGLLLSAMIYHVVDYERGSEKSALDFCITVGGMLYLGWLGSYFVGLRDLTNGQWWLLLAIPSVWLADTGAYLIGMRFGKHAMAPRLSPKKTWEGYLGGLAFGILGTAGLAALWALRAPEVTPVIGAFLGLVIAVLTPLGDLGESLFKRQFGLKDSGSLLPGHGGVMDRVDSWLWAAVIGFYLVNAIY